MKFLLIITISLSFLTGCKVNSDQAKIETQKFRQLASLKKTSCTDDKDEDGEPVVDENGKSISELEDLWPQKIRELEHQTVCATGAFDECYFSLNTNNDGKNRSALRYLRGTSLIFTGAYIVKAINRPSIWTALPPKPPALNGQQKRMLRNNPDYTGRAPLKKIDPDELAKDIKAFKDKYRGKGKKAATGENMARVSALGNRFSHVDSVIRNNGPVASSGIVKKAEGNTLKMVIDLGENKSFRDMSEKYIATLKGDIATNPVRFAETLTQLEASIDDDLTKRKTRLYALLAEIGDDEGIAQNKYINDLVGKADGITDGPLKLSDLTNEVVTEADEVALKNKHASELVRKIRVLERKKDRINEQIGRIVHSKGFAKRAGANRFFTYFHYRKLLTVLRRLSGFNESLKNPEDIAKAISYYAHYGQADVSIARNITNSPAGYVKTHRNTTKTYLNNAVKSLQKKFELGEVSAEVVEQSIETARQSGKISRILRSKAFVDQINQNIVEYEQVLSRTKVFNKTFFQGAAQVFIDYANSGVKPKNASGVATQILGRLLEIYQKQIDKDGVKALAKQFKSSPAVQRIKTSVAKKIGKISIAGPAVALGAALTLLDFDFYYLIGCSINNLRYRKYSQFFHDDCSLLNKDMDEIDEANTFAQKFANFTQIDPENANINLRKQLQALAANKKVCDYMELAYENLVDGNQLECIKLGDPNATDDDQYTHGYIGKRRFNLLLNPDDSDNPYEIELKSEVERINYNNQDRREIFREYDRYRADAIGEEYEHYSIGTRNLFRRILINEKHQTINDNTAKSAYRIFKVKSATRSLMQHHYCCTPDFETSIEMCYGVKCDTKSLRKSCDKKPQFNWGRPDIADAHQQLLDMGLAVPPKTTVQLQAEEAAAAERVRLRSIESRKSRRDKVSY